MDDRSLLDAIREDPDDDGPRLRYADWLEANQQPERAEWIRASCEFAHIPYGDERWDKAIEREMAAFGACKPAWWEPLSNIDQENDRGMFRFVLGDVRSSRGPTPVKRLGKVPWLGQAFDEGWLQRIELKWDDGTLAPLVAKWKAPASTVPLLVRPAPQIDDEGLRRVLELRPLQALELQTNILRLPSVRELARYPDLVELAVEFRLVAADTIDAVLAQIIAMPELRRLHLMGHERLDHGNRPNDADLPLLRAAPKLRRLRLSASPAVTERGIEELKSARPDVIVVHA